MNLSDTAATEPNKLKKAVILAVDDDPTICELLQMCFDMPQYHLLVAQNGDDALAIYRQHATEIDLVLLDVMLPTMSGIDVFRGMKAIDAGVKCLFVSGSLGSLNVEMLRGEGVMGFIEKPFRIEALMHRVANMLMIDTIRNELQTLED